MKQSSETNRVFDKTPIFSEIADVMKWVMAGVDLVPLPKSEASSTSGSRSGILVACPSLSLRHEHKPVKRDAASPPSREEAAAHAAALLGRPDHLCVQKHASGCKVSATTSACFTPAALCNNIYESFATLVDSRLRAYATLITTVSGEIRSRGVSRSDQKRVASERKLESLYEIAHTIQMRKMQTSFLVQERPAVDDYCSVELIVSMDLTLLGWESSFRHIDFEIKVKGEMKKTDPQHVVISLDTVVLLKALISRASKLVELVAEAVASRRQIQGITAIPRNRCFLDVAPNHVPSSTLQAGLDLLSSTAIAACTPVVSPDFRPVADESPMSPPALKLGSVTVVEPENDYCQLSVDQCAVIVDNIFGEGVDESVFREPPRKVARIGG